MPRMRATLICLLFIFTGVANAQLGANSTIDPSTVSATVRSQWCEAQINTCGVLCSGDANTNTCDTTTLDYGCTCASNSSAPGLLYYTETIPTYCCEQNYANCISAASGDASAQATCQQNEKTNCGHLDPANFTAVPVASASTSSATVSGTKSKSSSLPSSLSSSFSAATSASQSSSSLRSSATSATGSSTSPNTSQQTNTGTSSPAHTSTHANHGLSTGAKAGIGIGAALGALLIVALVLGAFCYGKRSAAKKTTTSNESNTFEKAELGPGRPRPAELSGEPLTSEEKEELDRRRRAAELEGVPPISPEIQQVGERAELEALRGIKWQVHEVE